MQENVLGSSPKEQGIQKGSRNSELVGPVAPRGRLSAVSVSCLELGVARCRRTIFAE